MSFALDNITANSQRNGLPPRPNCFGDNFAVYDIMNGIQALKFEIGDSKDGDDGDYYSADETLPRFPNQKLKTTSPARTIITIPASGFMHLRTRTKLITYLVPQSPIQPNPR